MTADLKKIYTAVTLDEAENELLQFGKKWRGQYPSCVKSREENWDVLSTSYEYLPEIRKIISNIIEGLNRQFRQITKNKPSFTNDGSLHRMLYLAAQRIQKHWHARCQNWDLVLSQLDVLFSCHDLDFVEFRLHKILRRTESLSLLSFFTMINYAIL